MPVTGSHPAAVLPLMRLGFVPSALVIGSMVPDLPHDFPPYKTVHGYFALWEKEGVTEAIHEIGRASCRERV